MENFLDFITYMAVIVGGIAGGLGISHAARLVIPSRYDQDKGS